MTVGKRSSTGSLGPTPRANWSRWSATVFIWLSRCLFVGAPLGYGLAWVFRPQWVSSSQPLAGWVEVCVMLLLPTWLFLLPLVLLNWAPKPSLVVTADDLVGMTTLGRRRLELRTARIVVSGPVVGAISSTLHLIADGRNWLLIEIDGILDHRGALEPPETLFAAARDRPLHWYLSLATYFATLGWLFASVMTSVWLLELLRYQP